MQLNLWIFRRRARGEDGQSVAEFAMTIPFLVMFAFFIVQFSVVFSMVHQASFASFAAARHHRVADNHDEQAVIDAVLRGTFWTQINPTWDEQGTGGAVVIPLQNLNTQMAYWPRGMLGCKDASTRPLACRSYGEWRLPTHLGENVYVEGIRRFTPMYGDRQSGISPKVLTDNNIDDG